MGEANKEAKDSDDQEDDHADGKIKDGVLHKELTYRGKEGCR